MTTRRILATSGGFLPSESRRENARRPRVLFVMTASGDHEGYVAMSHQATRDLSVDSDHLVVFPYPNQEPDEAFGRADVVWVGGGAVANLLALWRVHGIDEAATEAWERGVVLGGVSAGSICWHVGGTTDSFGPDLRIVTGGLGLLPYANGVHHDTEAQRRPLLQSLVASGELPLAYATDDRVGILYEGTDPVEVLTDHEVDPRTGPAAYRVARDGDRAVETRLAPGRID